MTNTRIQRNWKQIARGLGLGIPESDLEKMAPVLAALDAAFAPLAAGIPHEVEPAVTFHCPAEDEA